MALRYEVVQIIFTELEVFDLSHWNSEILKCLVHNYLQCEIHTRLAGKETHLITLKTLFCPFKA